MKNRFVGQNWPLAAAGVALALCVSGSHAAITQAQVAKPVIKRASAEEIRKQVDRAWVTKAATTDLMAYWNKHSVEPNGFIQENLDRQWKPWGTQREASVNGQGRQLYSMAVGYEMAPSKETKAALTRGMDFLLKMRDPEFGGYYDRVGPNHESHQRQQDRLQQLRALLAGRGRTRHRRSTDILDAAMVFFREMRDKMRDGPFIGSGSYSARLHAAPAWRDVRRRASRRRRPGAARPWRARPRLRPAPARPARASGVRRRRGRRPASPLVVTASTCTCSRRCCRSTSATESEEVWYEINQN